MKLKQQQHSYCKKPSAHSPTVHKRLCRCQVKLVTPMVIGINEESIVMFLLKVVELANVEKERRKETQRQTPY